MNNLAAALLLTLVPFSAKASIEGIWTCTTRLNNTTTNVVTGKKLSSQKIVLDSNTAFFSDGSFEATTANLPVTGQGTWVQKGRNFAFQQDPANAAINAEYGCSLTGATCTVLSTFNRYVGKELRRGFVLKGENKLRLTMLVNGLMLRTVGKGKFVCHR